MKRHLPAFLTTLLLAVPVTWAIAAVLTKPGHLPPGAGISPAKAPGIQHGIPAKPKAASAKPAQPEQQVARWEEMAESPDTLLAADAEIRKLPLSVFPAICNEALKIKDPEGHPVMRLLCIRWAELD